ncbi:MAG: histidinol dehydrogenase [Rhodospirillaceae bacterium]|nr:histidinol dehydrogenase [Rhodospirillaceae bacterium]MCA8931701.1 histidinol dehydrogenase [Rhodospirillaceae bacterium]
MAIELSVGAADFPSRFNDLVAGRSVSTPDVAGTVRDIVDQVRQGGDAALLELTAKFDGQAPATVAELRVDLAEMLAAADQVPEAVRAAIDLAAERIMDFHLHQRPETLEVDDASGVKLSHRWTPVEAIGIYVPGGRASYPSTLLMNAIPAHVAGVSRVVMVCPSPAGQLDPVVLYAASRAGVTEIWRVGGAQAVAALAYGTETIQPVDKIVGPGNAYVAEAKRQVFGKVGIDMIAGPSEILVVADAQNDPSWIAIDLLSQAEHDPDAQSILITDDAEFAQMVAAAVETWLGKLPQPDTAARSWADNGAIILVNDLAEAAALVDRLAPEHVELAVADPTALVNTIRHAGTIFLGRQTPEAIGDYVAGTNHVLPTARSARFSSGLGVLDFMKRTSLVACTNGGLRVVGPAAVALAEAEGLGAHAQSVRVRLQALGVAVDPAE